MGSFTYDLNPVPPNGYFNALAKVIDSCQMNDKKPSWTHIDLLVFLERNQAYIHKTLFKVDYGLAFILAQLDIAKKRLEYLHPKIILVSNTMARELLGKNKHTVKGEDLAVWMGFDFDAELGTFRIVNNEHLEGTPVFFSSMLSGQRALDNVSKERLVWHMKEAFWLFFNLVFK